MDRASSLATEAIVASISSGCNSKMPASQSPIGYAGLRVTKPYPTGAAHRADSAWKAKVVARLKEKGWTRKDLAEAIGCDPSAITVVLRPATVQTRLMPAINAALGMD